MTKLIIIIIIDLIAAAVFYLFFFKKKDNTKKTGNREDAVKFVQRLTELGYFKYTDAKDIDSLKEDMIDSYDTAGFTTPWNEDLRPIDYRFYLCDGEDLFEEGGFTELLQRMQPTFNKIGLTINVTAQTEVADNNGLNHTITINGTEYSVFKNFNGKGWGEAVERFVTIINDQLQKQNKEDRLYPISGGNDGLIIFLSDAQFEYLDSIYKNNKWKPLHIKDWCEVNEVAYHGLL